MAVPHHREQEGPVHRQRAEHKVLRSDLERAGFRTVRGHLPESGETHPGMGPRERAAAEGE